MDSADTRPLAVQPLVRVRAWPVSAGEASAIVLAGGLLVALLAASLRHAQPLGFAGFYSLVADRIAAGNGALPVTIPYYGGTGSGVPFAYPPLGLYLMALVKVLTGAGDMTYLKVAPPIFTALATLPLYRFFRQWSGSSVVALIGCAFVLAMPVLLVYQAMADGSVRGLAFLFTAAGLASALRLIDEGDRKSGVLASLLLGCTVLTHLANAMFFLIVLMLYPLERSEVRRRYRRAGAVAAGGLALALPWTAVVVARHGVSPFLYASHSHTATGIADLLLSVLPPSVLWYPEYAIALAGALLCLRQGRVALPGVLVLSILMPDGVRFVAVTVGFLAALTLGELMTRADSRTARLLTRASAALLVLWTLFLFTFWSLWVQPVLTGGDVAAAGWTARHTPRDARVLVLAENRQEAEWFPYLSRRNGVIAEWGSEWTAGYAAQHNLFTRQARCVDRQSWPCLTHVLSQGLLRPDYIVLLHAPRYPTLASTLSRTGQWSAVWSARGTSVWRRT